MTTATARCRLDASDLVGSITFLFLLISAVALNARRIMMVWALEVCDRVGDRLFEALYADYLPLMPETVEVAPVEVVVEPVVVEPVVVEPVAVEQVAVEQVAVEQVAVEQVAVEQVAVEQVAVEQVVVEQVAVEPVVVSITSNKEELAPELDGMSKPALKALCKERGLPVSGNKGELIRRLSGWRLAA